MEYPTEGRANSIVNDLVLSLDLLEKAYRIELAMSAIKRKLKSLRLEYASIKRKASVIYNQNKRYLPEILIGSYRKTIDDAQDILKLTGDKKCTRYKPLLSEKICTMPRTIDRRLKRKNVDHTNVNNADMIDDLHVIRRDKTNKEGNFKRLKLFRNPESKFYSRDISLNHRSNSLVFPEWNEAKSGEIKVHVGETMKIHEIYEPAVSSNPFFKFMFKQQFWDPKPESESDFNESDPDRLS